MIVNIKLKIKILWLISQEPYRNTKSNSQSILRWNILCSIISLTFISYCSCIIIENVCLKHIFRNWDRVCSLKLLLGQLVYACCIYIPVNFIKPNFIDTIYSSFPNVSEHCDCNAKIFFLIFQQILWIECQILFFRA